MRTRQRRERGLASARTLVAFARCVCSNRRGSSLSRRTADGHAGQSLLWSSHLETHQDRLRGAARRLPCPCCAQAHLQAYATATTMFCSAAALPFGVRMAGGSAVRGFRLCDPPPAPATYLRQQLPLAAPASEIHGDIATASVKSCPLNMEPVGRWSIRPNAKEREHMYSGLCCLTECLNCLRK